MKIKQMNMMKYSKEEQKTAAGDTYKKVSFALNLPDVPAVLDWFTSFFLKLFKR